MNKVILASSILSILSFSSFSQETKSFLSDTEQYKKAIDLFEKQVYPASYALAEDILYNFDAHEIIQSETTTNLELVKALSTTYSEQPNGVFLIEKFIKNHPNHPNNSEARLQLATYYFQKRNFNQAYAYMSAIDRNQLSNDQVEQYNLNMGYVLFVKKEFKKAEQYLKPVANGYSLNKEEAKYYLGLSQYFQGDYGSAIETLQEVENNPKYANEIPYYKARILFEQKNYAETIRFVEPLLGNRIKRTPEVNQLLGQSYFNLEQYDKALPLLESYSENAKQQSAEAQYQLAYTQYQMGQYQKAVKSFEKLNILDNETGQYALYALGDSYLKVNEKKKAKNAFATASTLDYNSKIKESASFNEAKLSFELGRSNEAISLANSFIKTYPNSEYTTEAKEILINLLLNSNNYKEAYTLLNEMPNRSSKMNEAYQKVSYLRAVELYTNGQLAAAKPLFDNVLVSGTDQRYKALANYWLGEMAYEYGRYSVAEEYINRFLNTSIQKPKRYLSQANYTLGYINYKQKNYQKAAQFFTKVDEQQSFYEDANVRAGDSYFATKNYTQAKRYYQKVQSAGSTKNYANYQLAILAGLNGNNSLKLQKLQTIYSNKSSVYADEALYETARTYVTQSNFSKAEQLFNQYLRDYPSSNKNASVYTQLGLINFNQKNYDQALSYYDKIVTNYPNSEEAATALTTIEQIYIESGRPNEYFAYIKNKKGISISDLQKEEIVFSAAEVQFQKGNCTNAVNNFNKYLNQYPNGIYSANAYFYRGECYLQQGNTAQAFQDFESIVRLPKNKFTERSLARLARQNYLQKNFSKSIEFYQVLEQEKNSFYYEESQIGLMQAFNQLNDRNAAAKYSDRVLKFENIDNAVIQEAKFINGIQHYNVGNLEQASIQLTDVANTNVDTFGAEARYILGKIDYDKQQYKKSIETLYRVADETPSEDDWVAKSFLLIADNYIQLNELFQAKATLNSILENYSGSNAEILNEARSKKQMVEAKERNNSNIAQPSSQNQLQLQE